MDTKILSPKERYMIKWAGRCQYDQHDKIWGWFYYFQQGYNKINDVQPICYAFWAKTGKKPSFKKHEYNKWSIQRLQHQKLSKGYNKIESSELEQIWPTIWQDIENNFVFYLLSEKI